MVGRITEVHLAEAEKTFPGIGRLYNRLSVKPATFLQLVWHYETRGASGRRTGNSRPARRANRL